MFNKPVAIVILLSLLTVNFASLFVFAGFELNKQYIADRLCVNKNKPELHCNGKCYLMKKLRMAQDKEQKQERQSQKTQIQDALVIMPLKFEHYSATVMVLHIPFSTGVPNAIRIAIFHPPQVNV
ncbi:hypothetical protein PBAL39_18059 [Pedobacter sp. BAL39]|uniref:hypothetical protein n=1 Tax=Pedobacter sp. BAL39 TaxID=391596 RepID=UPI000155A013|nr:hypothetical protein [Pedobacter sp. BAL39]EDM36804.1 hypothetical protein PBAL39_18059 [Pedobacter sp. BAL39]